MTVTGRFLADFSEFSSAVQGAVADLGGLESAGDDTARALSDLGDPAPVKETTQATEDLTGATTAAGDAFAGLGKYIAGALTIGAVTAFASAVIDLAGEIEHLSDMTGLSGDAIQRLMAVSNATSVPVDQLAKASTNLTIAVGDHSAGLVWALGELGIEFDTFAKLTPDQQFETLATAIGGVESHTDQLKLSMAAFGDKLGKEIVPAMRKDFGDLADATVKMSDDARAGLNRLETAWKNFKTSVKAIVGEMAAPPTQAANPTAFGDNADLMRERAALDHAAEVLGDKLPEAAGQAYKSLEAYHAKVLETATALPAITTATIGIADENKRLADEAARMAPIWAAEKAELDKFNAAMGELNTAGATYHDTLEAIDGEVVAAIQYYLDAGVAQGTLATAYGLTATQVKAIATALNEETKAHDAANKEILAGIDAWAKNQTAIAEHDRTLLQSDETTKAHFQKLADDAGAAFAFATAHGDDYTNARIEQLRREKEAADTALAEWSQTAETEIGSVKTAADGAAAALELVTTRIGGANQAMETWQGGTRLQGSHTEVLYGNRYLVSPDGHKVPLGPTGELPGNWFEMYTGQSNFAEAYNPIALPLSAQPNSGQVNVNATFNYPIMDDPAAKDAIGRLVGDAVMSRMTRTGALV